MNRQKRARTSAMQQYLRELQKEENDDLSSDEPYQEEEKDQIPAAKSKRGRKPIPEKWTRVISVYHDPLDEVRSYDLGPELLLDASLGPAVAGRGRPINW